MDNNEHIPTGQSLRYAWPAARDMHKKMWRHTELALTQLTRENTRRWAGGKYTIHVVLYWRLYSFGGQDSSSLSYAWIRNENLDDSCRKKDRLWFYRKHVPLNNC